jgi:hypothetical protein
MARPWWLLVFAALIVPSQAFADDADNPRAREKPPSVEEIDASLWKEAGILLPSFPRAEHLLPLRHEEVGSGYKYYLDVTSISRDADDVTRFTVVMLSPSGSGNIFYEGIRCATQELKTYAYGTKGGQFARLANPQWTGARGVGPLAYREMVAKRYICDEDGWASDTDSVLDRLVRLDPRRPRFAPRTSDESSD